MKPSRSFYALWLSASLVSGCQLRGCGGCGGGSGSESIPATPQVEPQPLSIPAPVEATEGAGTIWVNHLETAVQAIKRAADGDPDVQGLSTEPLREQIGQLTGSPVFARKLQLDKPLGCAVFDPSAALTGGALPVSCVLYVEGGLSGMQQAFAEQGGTLEDGKLSVSIQGMKLEFRAWPKKDAVWLTGGADYEQRAKPLLTESFARAQGFEGGGIELSVFVSRLMDRFGMLARPMAKTAVTSATAGVPGAGSVVGSQIDRLLDELEHMTELRLSLQRTKQDLRVTLSERMTKDATSLNTMSRMFDKRSIDPHLVGILPDSAFFVGAADFNTQVAADADGKQWNAAMDAAKQRLVERGVDNEQLVTELSDWFKQLVQHAAGQGSLAMFSLPQGPPSGVLLYRVNPNEDARDFWKRTFDLLKTKEWLELDLTADPNAPTVDGVKWDRYLPNEQDTEPMQLDVGQLDDIGILLVSPVGSDQAAQRVVAALRGQGRLADKPAFAKLGGALAGNHIGFGVNMLELSKHVDEDSRLNPTQPGEITDVLGVARVEGQTGMALQLRVDLDALFAFSKAVNASRPWP